MPLLALAFTFSLWAVPFLGAGFTLSSSLESELLLLLLSCFLTVAFLVSLVTLFLGSSASDDSESESLLELFLALKSATWRRLLGFSSSSENDRILNI